MNQGNSAIVQISPRGQLTLPAKVRKALGVEPGDNLVIHVEDGRAIVQLAVVVPVERYSKERIREFEKASSMSPPEIKRARRKWRL
jgi:antitoxin PrlF